MFPSLVPQIPGPPSFISGSPPVPGLRGAGPEARLLLATGELPTPWVPLKFLVFRLVLFEIIGTLTTDNSGVPLVLLLPSPGAS